MTDRDREPGRLPAIDFMRGFVMVVMTLDHASGAFNAARTRVNTDGAAQFDPTTVFEPLQFLARWVTHLCAPTFVMLSGMALAISVARRKRDGMESWAIDRDILIRGALIVGLEIVWMSWMWKLATVIQMSVLYAIGMSMIGMIPLRRLRPAVVGALGVAVMAGGEAVASVLDPSTLLAAATMTGGHIGPLFFLYPFLPWTGFMMVGWALGCRIAGRGMRSRDWLALAAVCALVFVVFRGLNGYGNADLLRREGGAWTAWIEWLHVSKYPPSLTFAALELGIAFSVLAAIWQLPLTARIWKPVLVFGQTALFYYLFHGHIVKGVALALGVYQAQSLGITVIAWGALLVVMYPLCRWYLAVKRSHPDSVLRFV